MAPKRIPDIDVWANDPLDIKVTFQNPDQSPIDVSASAFTVTMRGDINPVIDMATANVGIIYIRLTNEQTKDMLPYVTWDLFESPRWGRTIITGRLVRNG
jgi:hypothetical protein